MVILPANEAALALPNSGQSTPHDLRRTCLTWITWLGFSRDAMDRIANYKTSTVTDVYDRHSYAKEDRRIMASVARPDSVRSASGPLTLRKRQRSGRGHTSPSGRFCCRSNLRVGT